MLSPEAGVQRYLGSCATILSFVTTMRAKTDSTESFLQMSRIRLVDVHCKREGLSATPRPRSGTMCVEQTLGRVKPALPAFLTACTSPSGEEVEYP